MQRYRDEEIGKSRSIALLWMTRKKGPSPPLFLQKIDTTGFRGWGSDKRLWGKELEER
jgi:hypothetical protein